MSDETIKVDTNEETIKLRVEKLYKDAPLPTKPTCDTDAGYDVVAHNVSRIYVHYGSNSETLLEGEAMENKFINAGTFELQTGERALIGTGLKMTVGPGYELQVRPRSGLALKKGLTVLNAPGTIDEAYRNEVGVIIINTSRQVQTITLGDRIAQIVPKKVELLEIVEEKLSDADERDGGFGHSGHQNKRTRDFEAGLPQAMVPNHSNKYTPFNFM
jgi:dUTP pyrophosphatase